MSARIAAWLGILVVGIGIGGCGGGSEEQEERTGAVVEESNELVELRVRAVREEDRFSTRDPGEGVTAVDHEGAPERGGVAGEIAKLEPGADWRSERLSVLAAKQLRGVILESAEDVTAPGFVCEDLRPDDLVRREFRGGYAILRPERKQPGERKNEGQEGLTKEIDELRASFAGGEFEASCKVTGIEMGEGEFSTRVLVELWGEADTGRGAKQVTAEWRARWTDVDPPRLLALEAEHYEEAVGMVGFVDATREVLGGTPYFESQVLTGVDFWAARITRLGDFSLTGHHGLAVGDVNGDGREDLFVCDGGSLPNRLYVQEDDGTVRDVSKESGVDWFEDSRSALLVDLDNDGDQDLVVATIAMIAIAENDGTGKFTARNLLSGGGPTARNLLSGGGP